MSDECDAFGKQCDNLLNLLRIAAQVEQNSRVWISVLVNILVDSAIASGNAEQHIQAYKDTIEDLYQHKMEKHSSPPPDASQSTCQSTLSPSCSESSNS
jgi:hypothetical protein